jgi:hypothetical protein
VTVRARWVATTLSLPDDLVTAAWLHDIGYAPDLRSVVSLDEEAWVWAGAGRDALPVWAPA